MMGLALGAVLLFTGCSKSDERAERRTPVRVIEVKPTRVSRQAHFSANILPATRVDMAFKIGGYVEWIATSKDGKRPLGDGDTVEKGDLLVRVRAGEVTNKVGEVEALQSGAQVQQDAAKQEFERARTLFERGVISKSQFDLARAQYRGATAQVEAASAGRKQVGSIVGDTTLRAPISGTILKRLIEVGSLVGPGSPAYVVADVTRVKASFGVPDAVLGTLKVGSPVSLSIEALPGRTFAGVVSQVAPAADLVTRTFEVETTIPNNDGVLKVGMVASVRLGEESADDYEVLLPLSAIVRSPSKKDGYAVYVVEAAGEVKIAKLREVELGEIYASSVPAKSGLKTGELVVVMGTGLLSPDERVDIIPDENVQHASAK